MTDADFVELLDALEGVVTQACLDHGVIDSMAMSAYAEGMRVLAKHRRITITDEWGRRVIATQNTEGGKYERI